MCSGIRDAKNLAWKLDLVLRDKAEESLFESYQVERYDHCKTLINMAIELGKLSAFQMKKKQKNVIKHSSQVIFHRSRKCQS